jgi:hypothetical protein
MKFSGTRLSSLLVLAFLLLGANRVVAEVATQGGGAPAQPANAAQSCTTSVAMVSPEFVVIGNVPQSFPFTVIASCLDRATQVFLVDGGTSVSLTLSPPAKDSKRSQTVHGNAALSNEGTYAVCIAGLGAQTCNPVPSSPTVVAVASSSCSDPAIPMSYAPSLANLRSESPIVESVPPGIAERCDLDPAHADKAIIVDAETGLTCTSTDPGHPDDGCLGKKADKRPLQLRAGDTVRLYIVKKNPFLQNYKFSSTDSQIKDDDIGTFLGMLVPGISGASGQKSSSAGSGAGDSATAAVLKAMHSTQLADSLQQSAGFRGKTTEEVKTVIDKAKNDQDAAPRMP